MVEPFAAHMGSRKGLTPAFVAGLKPASMGNRYEVRDCGETAALRIRVTPRGKRFYMSARWQKGASSATSRLLGELWDGTPPRPQTSEKRRVGKKWIRTSR